MPPVTSIALEKSLKEASRINEEEKIACAVITVCLLLQAGEQ
jgi:hypothetical protein